MEKIKTSARITLLYIDDEPVELDGIRAYLRTGESTNWVEIMPTFGEHRSFGFEGLMERHGWDFLEGVQVSGALEAEADTVATFGGAFKRGLYDDGRSRRHQRLVLSAVTEGERR